MESGLILSNKMNVGIFTIDTHCNYGNRLQNFALQSILKKFCNPVSVWWSCDYELFEKDQFSLKEKLKFVLNYKDYQKKILHDDRIDAVKEYQIKKFSDQYINIRQISQLSELYNEMYDAYVVGSDQVWNPLFWHNYDLYSKIMLLNFTEKRKIAYAASIGLYDFPKCYVNDFCKSLDSFDSISVREKRASEIIKNLIGRDVPVLVDPTMLLSAKEWSRIEFKPEWLKESKYLLTYFLGEVPHFIKKLAKENNISIINLMDKKIINIYASRVEEFIFLIHHCDLFITDSFHGCVFSILFKKPFLVVNREEKGVPVMTCRIDTLLDTFKLKDRYISFNSEAIDYDNVMNPDYSRIDEILFKEREKSNEFIRKSLL